eukprot:756376-Amphidinium_carterae.1
MIKLPDRVTSKRAPGPGPLLKDDWLPIAEQFLSGKNVVLNTDSARAYEAEIEGGSTVQRPALLEESQWSLAEANICLEGGRCHGEWCRAHRFQGHTDHR